LDISKFLLATLSHLHWHRINQDTLTLKPIFDNEPTREREKTYVTKEKAKKFFMRKDIELRLSSEELQPRQNFLSLISKLLFFNK
jgi:hypothetical protein